MTRRILVVDDEPDMRLILGLTLTSAGFGIVEAETGEAAIDLVAKEPFDLVLLDLNLPGLSGLEVLEKWASAGVVPALPVLVLTADARPALDAETTSRGARACLRKPLPSAELVARITDTIAAAATVEDP